MGKDIKGDPSGSSTKASVPNGDISTGTKSASSISAKSSSAGHTPVQKHRSVVSLPMPPETVPKRDSSVFDMIAGTKSKSYGNNTLISFYRSRQNQQMTNL